jgi:hypothetical protein
MRGSSGGAGQTIGAAASACGFFAIADEAKIANPATTSPAKSLQNIGRLGS